MNKERVTDVTGMFLECFDIARNLYLLAEVVVFLWRVFIDIVAAAIGIFNRVCYDSGIVEINGHNK